MLRKLHRPVALLMLVVIMATLFVHSNHFSQAKLDDSSVTKKHDCVLCQQGFDSTTKKINLAFVERGIFIAFKTKVFDVYIVFPAYILPLLRAPPKNKFL